MNIRPFCENDKIILLNLLRLNTPDFFASEEEQDFIFYLDNESENYFVVLEGEQVVGCGGFNLFPEEKTARISWDIFHPDYQNKGYGSALLKFRIEKIKSLNEVDYIIVRTSQHAEGFYRKSGFSVMEIIADYWAPGYHLYQMEIHLTLNPSPQGEGMASAKD
jgi:[ribosomal protein S18]-alanine N-acetyltransferase